MKLNQKKLPFSIILLAIQGDVIAVNHVLKHFETYIIKLSQKTLYDEFGTPHIHVEPEIKRTLETKLIMAILKFSLN